MSRRSPRYTLALVFIAGLLSAVLLQLAGIAVVPPDKTSTLLGVAVGAVVGLAILWVFRATRHGKV